MLEPILSSVFLHSLSLTLLHFLWQGLLVAFILKSCFVFIGHNKPQVRYLLATTAMLINFILPFITFIFISQHGVTTIDSLVYASDANNFPTPLSSQGDVFTFQHLSEYLPYVSLFWLAAVILLSSKLLIEIYNVNQLPKQGNVDVEPALLARFSELATQLKLNKTPKLLVSLKVNVPMAIGWLKPVVLLPASMVSGLSSAQLEMLILHELAHIRRYDYLVNFLQTMVEILLFFHPGVMWVSKQIRHEREYCSDDIAVHHCGNAVAYAHTLADTATLLTKQAVIKPITIPSMAIAASGGDLKQRVIRLVDHHHCSSSHEFSKWLAALTIISAMLFFSSTQFLTHNLTYSMFDLWSYNAPWFKSSDSTLLKQSTLVSQPKPIIEQNLTKTTFAQQLLFDKQQEPELPKAQQQKTNILSDKSIASSHLISEILSPTQHKVSTENQLHLAKADSVVNINTEELPTSPHSELLKPVGQNDTSIKIEQALAINETEILTTSYVNSSISTQSNSVSHSLSTPQLSSSQQHPAQQYYAQQVAYLSVDDITNDESFFAEPFNAAMHASPTLFVESLAVMNNAASSTANHWFKAEQLATSEPKYPTTAKRKGLEIEARIFFTIDKNGLIKDVQFEHKSKMSYFKNAIRIAIRKWRFIPATLNGKPVESRMSKIFSFSLQD